MKTYNWPGKERREPTCFQPDYLTLRHLRDDMEMLLRKSQLNANSKILDIGCGTKPYFPIFAEITKQYVGIDLHGSPQVDIVADLSKPIPFSDSYFDMVISTQVLEHVENPRRLVEEMYRVCRTNGIVFVSVPFVWEIHNYPKDFWRFSEQGLALLFEKFRHIEIKRYGNSAQAIIQTTNLFIDRWVRFIKFKQFIFMIANSFLLPAAGRFKDVLLPANYSVTAIK